MSVLNGFCEMMQSIHMEVRFKLVCLFEKKYTSWICSWIIILVQTQLFKTINTPPYSNFYSLKSDPSSNYLKACIFCIAIFPSSLWIQVLDYRQTWCILPQFCQTYPLRWYYHECKLGNHTPSNYHNWEFFKNNFIRVLFPINL